MFLLWCISITYNLNQSLITLKSSYWHRYIVESLLSPPNFCDWASYAQFHQNLDAHKETFRNTSLTSLLPGFKAILFFSDRCRGDTIFLLDPWISFPLYIAHTLYQQNASALTSEYNDLSHSVFPVTVSPHQSRGIT